MEKCDKHQHKQRHNLKELGKWDRQGQNANHHGKCKWICLGQNNPQTRYSLGRKILKHIKNRKVCSKMVASDSSWDQGGVGRQEGNRLGRWVVLTGGLLTGWSDLITGPAPPFSSPNVFPAPFTVPLGWWGWVACLAGTERCVWNKQVTFQSPDISFGVSFSDWSQFFLFSLFFLLLFSF